MFRLLKSHHVESLVWGTLKWRINLQDFVSASTASTTKAFVTNNIVISDTCINAVPTKYYNIPCSKLLVATISNIVCISTQLAQVIIFTFPEFIT